MNLSVILRHAKPPRLSRSLGDAAAMLEEDHFQNLPTILRDLAAAAVNRDTGNTLYCDMCNVDSSARTRLLMLANSMYYGPVTRHPIRDVRAAIERIGPERTRELMLRSSLGVLFKGSLQSNSSISDYSASRLWLNTVAVAAASREIYKAIYPRQSPVADPYLAGLLINIGIPVQQQCYAKPFAEAVTRRAELQSLLIEEESGRLQNTHPQLGALVAEHWELDPIFVKVIRHHHDSDVRTGAHAHMVYVVRVAQWLAYEQGHGYSDFSQDADPVYSSHHGAGAIDAATYRAISRVVVDELAMLKALGWLSVIRIR